MMRREAKINQGMRKKGGMGRRPAGDNLRKEKTVEERLKKGQEKVREFKQG